MAAAGSGGKCAGAIPGAADAGSHGGRTFGNRGAGIDADVLEEIVVHTPTEMTVGFLDGSRVSVRL